MTLDASKVIFSSTIDTFKNFPSETGTISVPSQSYTSGQIRSFSTTIDLTRVDAVSLVLQNYSFDSLKYYIGSNVVLFGADSLTNFQIVTQGSTSGSTLTMTTFVLNTDVSSHTVPAFSVAIQVRRFTAPFA